MFDEQQKSLPVRAYINPIRSVLFVDDQFPTFTQPESGNQKERAHALWKACREYGWLCDIDNEHDWSTDERRKRLAASDLIVLDFHLLGDDPAPALKVIQHLAVADSPNLVIVYTADPALDSVTLRLASHARGVDSKVLQRELCDDVADLDGKIEWSVSDLRYHINGKDGWKKTYVDKCRAEDIDHKKVAADGQALIERSLDQMYGPPVVEKVRTIDAIGLTGGRWFQCGNLFVAVVGKPTNLDHDDEAGLLFGALASSIMAWNPSWLACLISLSRHQGNQGAFRDDLRLPNESLQIGLANYIASAKDDEEKGRRSRYIAADLLQRRFDHATTAMGSELLNALPKAEKPKSADLLRLNAFLCSQRHDRHHVRTGTVFCTESDGEFFVCVSPACDMVPRARKQEIDPWGVSLGKARAMLVVRLDMSPSTSTAISKAEEGRYVFFDDYRTETPVSRAAAVFSLSTNDPNPRIEHMFAKEFARVQAGTFTVRRVAANRRNVLSFSEQTCLIVSQLRAPYAERLTHIVGGHLSRIGVDFMSMSPVDG